MNRKILKPISVTILVLFIGACAKQPDQISSTYCSPARYQSYSCEQVGMELHRVKSKILEVSGQQESEATKDAVALSVGLVLFWPALFFMMGDDKKQELAALKGEYEALEEAAIQRECGIADEIIEARLKRAEEKEKMEKEIQEDGKDTRQL